MLRRTFLHGMLAAGSATLTGARIAVGAGSPPTAGPLTVDFHSHAWRRTDFATDLRRGGVNVVVMVVTSDRLLLNRDSGRQRALGTVAPGALYANATEQMAVIAQAAILRSALMLRSCHEHRLSGQSSASTVRME